MDAFTGRTQLVHTNLGVFIQLVYCLIVFESLSTYASHGACYNYFRRFFLSRVARTKRRWQKCRRSLRSGASTAARCVCLCVRLKEHYASYEPSLCQLKSKYEVAMKEKMLTKLERDRAVGQVKGLKTTLRSVEQRGTGAPGEGRGEGVGGEGAGGEGVRGEGAGG